MAKRAVNVFLALVLSVGLMWPILPGTTEKAHAAGAQIDLNQVFTEWVNFPGANLGGGYAAGWQYRGSDKALMTTENVGFTGYYNPLLMSFTTGTFAVNMLSGDADPWGFAWGLQKTVNSAGQDVYSFYMYEECGHNHWCIAFVEEWIPAKDGSPHRGPVYHSTIDAADSQYNHTGGQGSVGYTKGKILAHGPATVQNVNHRVTMKVEKNKITVTSPQVGINAVVEAPVRAGSFGPVTASNSSAFYYNLSMEAAEDNGAIKADFQTFDDGEPSSAGRTGDTLTMENRTWLDPATKATIKDTTWTVYDPSGKQIYTGTNPYSGVVDQEGEYRIVLEVLTSQGLTAKKTKYFSVSTESIVTVRYVDERGEKLTDNIVYKGRIGKPYQTSDLSFNGYVLAGVEGETSGVFADGPIGVTYSYKKLDEDEGSGETVDEAQPVVVRYVDQTGKSIMPNVEYKGAVGDPYATSKMDIPGYKFQRVEEVIDSAAGGNVPSGNTPDANHSFKGNFGYQKRTVTYHYKADAASTEKTGSVLVRYLDPDGHAISDDQMLTGNVGESFTIDIPSITKYRLETIDGTAQQGYTGTFAAEPRVINVVYSPITFTASSVMVLYRDPEGNTIRSIVIDGNAGEPYTTEALDIPGYELVEVPANKNGVFVADRVTQVLYQYKSTLNKDTEEGKINIDTDDDGLPDLNVDTDGDGKPDVNIDTDDDGIPDKNVVTDEEGKPVPVDPEEPAPTPTINIDTTGDGEPDVNVDTDGDGKPDVNVAVDDEGKPVPVDPSNPNPPKPFINVDTDGDGEPDVNIDTDGDGKPDINVVTDDEGDPIPVDPKKPVPPSINIYNPDLDPNDPKDPTKPNVNVDTDGNGIPDVNIDTDGDGEPDINIVDEDKDGKPDQVDPEKIKDDPGSVVPTVNVVVGDDGKPEPNIDPKDPHSPKKPDVNIDTDGDGKPDVNIDTTGDGKPDVNVDTTGDGKPNVNIDTTGDGKPDTNLDENGDGIVDRTGDGPDTEDKAAPVFSITTKLKGAVVGAQISPTLSIVKGKSATIDWTAGPHSYVKQVEVDGKVLPNTASYTFDNVDANHAVVVTMAPLPDIGGNTARGYYTVSVNKYGGPNAVEASSSVTLHAGESTTVTWKPAAGYEILRVLVDGNELSAEQVAGGSYAVSNISANHVVDVIAQPVGGTPQLRDNDLLVSTVIKGGPGTITGGSTVNRGSSYKVAWEPVIQTTTDVDDPNYAVYEVEKVEVNGHEVKNASDELTLTSIRENKDVVVTVKPITYDVTVLKYGNGSVSPSVTKFKGQRYIDIQGTPAASSHISYIEVDGTPVFDEKNPALVNPFGQAMQTLADESGTAARTGADSTAGSFAPEKIAVGQADASALLMGVSGIADSHVVKVYFAEDGKTANPTELKDKTITVVPSIEGGPGQIEGGGIIEINDDPDAPEEGPVVTWEIPDDYVVKEVIIDGTPYPVDDPDAGSIDIAKLIGKDKIVPGTEYKVTLVTEKRAPGDEDLPQTRELVTADSFSIDTSLTGGAGTITASGMVIEGGAYKVAWTVEDLDGKSYRVAKVLIDGVDHPELLEAGEYTFADVTGNHTIQVVLEPVPDDVPDTPIDEDNQPNQPNEPTPTDPDKQPSQPAGNDKPADQPGDKADDAGNADSGLAKAQGEAPDGTPSGLAKTADNNAQAMTALGATAFAALIALAFAAFGLRNRRTRSDRR